VKLCLLTPQEPIGLNVHVTTTDLFQDDYKEFVIGELTELWDTYY